MQTRIEPILGWATIVGAIASTAALTTGEARAESPTIDTPAFVSARARTDVQADVLTHRQVLSAAGGEWKMQRDEPRAADSSYTRAEAQAAFLAARQETSALTSEDSGSSYFARRAQRAQAMPVNVGAVR